LNGTVDWEKKQMRTPIKNLTEKGPNILATRD